MWWDGGEVQASNSSWPLCALQGSGGLAPSEACTSWGELMCLITGGFLAVTNPNDTLSHQLKEASRGCWLVRHQRFR